MTIASNVALVGGLCYHHRELLPLLEEHLQDNDGEVLAHVLLSEIIQWLNQHYKEHPVLCRQVWNWLEQAYIQGDDDERDLVAASGVDLIPRPGLPGSEIRFMLGPSLRQVDPWRG